MTDISRLPAALLLQLSTTAKALREMANALTQLADELESDASQRDLAIRRLSNEGPM